MRYVLFVVLILLGQLSDSLPTPDFNPSQRVSTTSKEIILGISPQGENRDILSQLEVSTAHRTGCHSFPIGK